MPPRSTGLQIKRVYVAPAGDDGIRVLVDRIWPRGLTKDQAAVELWLKEIAPSDALRKWFGHDPERWNEFRQRYGAELDKNGVEVERLRQILRASPVTLLYGAKDEQHNNARALAEYLQSGDRG
jgi:uncharacterized protein YeaO (DUF488 family)